MVPERRQKLRIRRGDEFADAVEDWQASGGTKRKPVLTLPLFVPSASPNPSCRRCRGVGDLSQYGPLYSPRLIPSLLRELSRLTRSTRARCAIRIEQADPDAALRELTAMTPGGYAPKQSESKTAVEHTHRVVPAELTAEEAIRLYRERQVVGPVVDAEFTVMPPAADITQEKPTP